MGFTHKNGFIFMIMSHFFQEFMRAYGLFVYLCSRKAANLKQLITTTTRLWKRRYS